METKSTINQRFIEAVNYLILVKSVKNKSDLAENLKLSKSKFSEILKERMNVGIDTIALFCLLYEIRVEWMIIGKGKMIRPNEFVPNKEEHKKIYLENVHTELNELELNYKELADARLEIIEGLKFKVKSLEKELSELKYTQKESFLYKDVAESAPELTKKTPK